MVCGRPALVMVGDLNSEPDTGAIRYLASGQVKSNTVYLTCTHLLHEYSECT